MKWEYRTRPGASHRLDARATSEGGSVYLATQMLLGHYLLMATCLDGEPARLGEYGTLEGAVAAAEAMESAQ